MEVWTGQADQEHAEDQRCSLPAQPLHHLDGSPQEEVPGDPVRAEEGQDEVQESNARGDHGESSWDEVSFNTKVKQGETCNLLGLLWRKTHTKRRRKRSQE